MPQTIDFKGLFEPGCSRNTSQWADPIQDPAQIILRPPIAVSGFTAWLATRASFSERESELGLRKALGAATLTYFCCLGSKEPLLV